MEGKLQRVLELVKNELSNAILFYWGIGADEVASCLKHYSTYFHNRKHAPIAFATHSC